MTLVDVIAIVLWLGVTTYAVFGGADFGAGFWDLVSGRGAAGARSRALIAAAIGPVWEANHTWLIFDLVILWTAFPVAFAAIMSSLFVPLSLAAVGIVLRGAAFVTGGLAVVGIMVLAVDAPILARELMGRGWPLVVAGFLLGGAALVAIGQRAPFGTRPLAVGAVAAVIWGWGVAQYPDILPGTLSLADAAAPAGSLGSLLVVFVAAALLIAPSLALLFWLTQQNRLGGHAAEAAADPAARVD